MVGLLLELLRQRQPGGFCALSLHYSYLFRPATPFIPYLLLPQTSNHDPITIQNSHKAPLVAAFSMPCNASRCEACGSARSWLTLVPFSWEDRSAMKSGKLMQQTAH